MLFAVVFKNKHGEWVVANTNSGTNAVFGEKGDACRFLSKMVESLDYFLAGSPVTYGFPFSSTTRSRVTVDDREQWERIKQTLDVKQIASLTFIDGESL